MIRLPSSRLTSRTVVLHATAKTAVNSKREAPGKVLLAGATAGAMLMEIKLVITAVPASYCLP
jgi:hypothetical protein